MMQEANPGPRQTSEDHPSREEHLQQRTDPLSFEYVMVSLAVLLWLAAIPCILSVPLLAQTSSGSTPVD